MRKQKSAAEGAGLPVAPVAMTVFWMLLGGAAGINVTQGLWHLLGWGGDVAVAVPVGAAAGAAVGALLGLIRDPLLLVLLMAVFAGSSAGAVAGRLAWGAVGEVAGQVTGGLLGVAAWFAWRVNERRKVRAAGRGADRADSPTGE
jgi:hypothetical protein